MPRQNARHSLAAAVVVAALTAAACANSSVGAGLGPTELQPGATTAAPASTVKGDDADSSADPDAVAAINDALWDAYGEAPDFAGVSFDAVSGQATLHWNGPGAPLRAGSTLDSAGLLSEDEGGSSAPIQIERAPYSLADIEAAMAVSDQVSAERDFIMFSPATDGSGIRVWFSPDAEWADMSVEELEEELSAAVEISAVEHDPALPVERSNSPEDGLFDSRNNDTGTLDGGRR